MTRASDAGQRRGRNLRFGYFVKPQLIKKLEHVKLSHSGYGNSVSISDTHVAVGAFTAAPIKCANKMRKQLIH